jgi:DNA-damage-inducible protein D
MDPKLIHALHEQFEGAGHKDPDGTEFWLARDLQELLGYSEWRNFSATIEKAKESCRTSNHLIDNHFVDVNKMVRLGHDVEREIDDVMLSRYACYLIAQNGDPKKPAIAFAQTYFAMQTRRQELLEQRLLEIERVEARQKLTETEKELSNALYEHGVDDKGFGYVRSRGDQALFGGISTKDMKTKLGVTDTRPLADFLPTITLKAKEFAAAITSFNVRKENIQGRDSVAVEHVKNNSSVRRALAERGIKPEELPAEEDIKKVARRLERDSSLPAPTEKLTKSEI